MLSNVKGDISQFTNDSGYLTSYTETQTLDDVTTLGSTTTNNISIGPNFLVGQGISTASAYLQLGSGRTASGYAYIDLVGDTTYTDYGLRVIRYNGGANTASDIVHRGTGQLSIISNEAAPILFKTSAAERMRIDSSGNVGIGTTSPTSSRLNVNSNGSSDSVIRIDGADARGASRYALQIVDSDTNSRGSIYVSTSSGPSATFVGGDYVAHSKSTDTFIAIAGRVNSYPAPSANASSIVTTRDGGTYPFNSYGHLVISSRHDSSRDILFRTNTPTEWLYRVLAT